MTNRKMLVIPPELSGHGESIASALREAMVAAGVASPQVELSISRSAGISSETLIQSAVLVVVGPPLQWFAKKWLDTYMWPVLQKKIDAPSKKIMEWLEKEAKE